MINDSDNDHTRTSATASEQSTQRPLLCITIVWHPDLARVGEQFMMIGDTLELTRYLPVFAKPRQPGQRPESPDLPLGYEGISRQALTIRRTGDEGISITPPASKMVVEVDGTSMTGSHSLERQQIEAGVILSLARAVLVCLHFMHCLPKHNPVAGLLGVGEAAIKTRDLIRQVATTDETVLLLGETGTGKEVAARAIHALSLRRERALVSVNMAALNEGLAAADLFGAAKGAYTGAQGTRGGFFQEAQDATLFLDEIGNAPAAVQPMLLRVLETGDYRPLGASRDAHSNARIIAATDQDLYADGFNQALLRRLESFIIPIAPLRARREDIGLLIVHLLHTSKLPDCAQLVLPPQLVKDMVLYDWPGNIRQLRHVVKRSLLALRAGDVPEFAALLDLPRPANANASITTSTSSVLHANPSADPAARGSAITQPATSDTTQAGTRKKPGQLSEQDILLALQDNEWEIQGAAQSLGISRPSLYRLLESHSQIRRPGEIPQEEINAALAVANSDMEACAAVLKTPVEALRRYLRMQQRAGKAPG
jgi:two-component system nitrogen regulation response regulator GlnG